MTSVERIQEYADLTPEWDKNGRIPKENWPEMGEIVFRKVYLKYSPEGVDVLRNLSLKIKSNEKVGVVGRTGAGKSSLIQAIFRLAYTNGAILIDGVDTKTVPLRLLRSKISIIPQEPILFSGTLRGNLDPFNEYSDEVIYLVCYIHSLL